MFQSKIKLIVYFIISLCFIITVYCCSESKSNVKNIRWINDSLNISGQNISARWIDTINTNFAFALYRKDISLLRIVHIKDRVTINEKVIITDLPNGTVKIIYEDPQNYNGEYFIVNQGILEMYNKEGKIFSKATRLKNITK